MNDRLSFSKRTKISNILLIICVLSTLILPLSPGDVYAEPDIKIEQQNGDQQSQKNEQNQEKQNNQSNTQNQGDEQKKQQPKQEQKQNNEREYIAAAPSSAGPVRKEKEEEGNFVTKLWNKLFGEPKNDKQQENQEKLEEENKLYSGCDMLDFHCKFTVTFLLMVKNAFESVVKFLTSSLFTPGSLVVNNQVFNKYFRYIKDLAWVLLEIFIVFQGIRLLSMSLVADNHTEVKTVIQKIFITAIILASMDWGFKELSRVNEAVVNGILTSGKDSIVQNFVNASFGQLVVYNGVIFAAYGVLTFFAIFMFGTVATLILIVLVQVCMRNAELAFLYIIGPLAIVTNLNEKYNYFHAWWKQVLSLTLTTSFQVLLLSITFELFFSNVKAMNFITKDIIFCLGFLILTVRAPKLLKDWIYSSEGTSVAIGRIPQKIVSKFRRKYY